jgi:hypothetical protein
MERTISVYSPCVVYRKGRNDRNWTTASLMEFRLRDGRKNACYYLKRRVIGDTCSHLYEVFQLLLLNDYWSLLSSSTYFSSSSTVTCYTCQMPPYWIWEADGRRWWENWLIVKFPVTRGTCIGNIATISVKCGREIRRHFVRVVKQIVLVLCMKTTWHPNVIKRNY